MHDNTMLEDYLLSTMKRLCPIFKPANAAKVTGDNSVDDILGATTPFARVTDAFGPSTMSSSRMIFGAPATLRDSLEHRYSLSKWPLFDFVILESNAGLAWDCFFERRVGVPVPPIQGMMDLSQWSHIESEVRAALGPPSSDEAWPPWESAIYRRDGASASLCYVFRLLQSVA